VRVRRFGARRWPTLCQSRVVRTTRSAGRLSGALLALLTLAAFWAAGPAFAKGNDPGTEEQAPPSPITELPLPLEELTFVADSQGARLEVPVGPEALFEVRADRHGWRLQLPGVLPPTSLPNRKDPVLGALEATVEGTSTVLTLPWRYWCPTEITRASAPDRVVFTFRETYTETEQETLAPGIRHTHIREGNPRQGPLDINILHIDPHVPGVRIEPALAGGDAMFARNTVSWITQHRGAIAGVNGSYFSLTTGEPLGLLVLNGRQVSSPLFNRAALALGDHGEVQIGPTSLTARLALPNGESYDLDGVNQPRGLNRMVLYTTHFGISTHTILGGQEFAVAADGTVLLPHEFDTTIPPGGYVLSAHGQAATWLTKRVKVGDRLTLTSPLQDFFPGMRQLVAGGPILLAEGRVALDTAAEHFRPDIAQGTAPRTAVGVTRDGQVLMMTVDGRHPWSSRGLTLLELATRLQALGAVDALNFDGGGSTAMAVGGQVVNHPSDGHERAVNNALLVFYGAEDTSQESP
jgi:exopolysaccharide biosynthesis protein